MIYETDFQKSIEDAFLAYGASVAQERAIPDVRDMIKIGLRQGLYAQYSNKLTYKDKFQKAQKSVAAAMSQSYVHGDAAMYDTFIRAARPWSYRYPLEAVQGNFGNPTSPDSHAAARYVEMKAAEISNLLFDGLKKKAIGDQYYNNYDDTELIPSVFPSIGYWNIVNGCSGIAVALATSVPSFNLREVNEALIKLIKDPNAPYDEIYCAPDFPCGGTITNAREVKEALKQGQGSSIRIRAKMEYIPDQHMIKATELPHGVFTNTVIEQLAELTADNPSYGIERVVDHTKREADIRIYLTKGANPNKMIEKLYKDTSLENWFSINMVLLDQGRFPKVFGWREACLAYIAHIRECKRNMIQFDLDGALARLNIVEGLLIAAASIDEVVAIIRSSNDPTEAATKLIARFGFNEPQVKAILAMKLASLTKIDAIKLNNEREELIKCIEEYRYLLNTPTALDELLIEKLQEVAKKYGDERRTKVENLIKADEEVELPAEQEVSVMLFDNNTIRVVEKDELQGAKRGRKGVNVKPPKNANLRNTLYTTNLGTISAFTNQGRMYSFQIHELDMNKDYSIYDILTLQSNEQVLLLIDSTMLTKYKHLVTVSQQGYIKKTKVNEYTVRARKGIAAVKLENNDCLCNVFLSSSDEDRILISNTSGYYNFYSLGDINPVGRNSRGVKAIKLLDGEEVHSATLVREGHTYSGILTVCANGYGKVTPLEDIPMVSRGNRGYKIINVEDSYLAMVYAVSTEQEMIYLTANNKAIIIERKDLSFSGRTARGARLINVTEDLRTPMDIM